MFNQFKFNLKTQNSLKKMKKKISFKNFKTLKNS